MNNIQIWSPPNPTVDAYETILEGNMISLAQEERFGPQGCCFLGDSQTALIHAMINIQHTYARAHACALTYRYTRIYSLTHTYMISHTHLNTHYHVSQSYSYLHNPTRTPTLAFPLTPPAILSNRV